MNFEQIAQTIRNLSDGALTNVSTPIVLGMAVITALLAVLSVISLAVSIILAVKYVKYNHRANSIGLTGEQAARRVLDQNGLSHIKVSASGSILFGNSYSHYFRKIRLRRRTWKEASISSLAMAMQKSGLAILDQQGDPDMRSRVKMTPVIYLGPLAFIPMILIGTVLDIFVFTTSFGLWTITFSIAGLVFYLISFLFSLMTLKTEMKAQKMALEMMHNQQMATAEEIGICKDLFRMYNIEYVNNMIISLLEMLLRVLQIAAKIQNKAKD